MILGERIAIDHVRVFYAVQQHVHAADTQHSVIKVKAVEQVPMEMLPQFGVGHHFGMSLAQRFAHGHQKAASSASRIANDVRGLRLDHLYHEPDDVARSTKLAVLPGARDLAQHVFVEIALGVPVFHRNLVDHVHNLRQ